MTLLFIDSFDHYVVADQALKWDVAGQGMDASYGRNGTGGMQNWSGLGPTKYIDNTQTLIMGVAFELMQASVPAGRLFEFKDSTTVQASVAIKADGAVEARLGTGTVLGTSSIGLVGVYTYYYLEAKVTIHNSTGIFEVRLNGTEILNLTGQDTQMSANAYCTNIRFQSPANNTRFDDFYLCDDQGTENNDFLGDVRVEAIRPTGIGNTTDFSPSTGANWENVDETYPDDDSTYNYHAPQGLPGTDTFQMGDLTTISGSIFGIQPIMFTRKDDAGSAHLDSIIRTGGTDYVGSGISLPDTYIYHRDILEQNPDGDVDWTVTDINNIEGGYKRTS